MARVNRYAALCECGVDVAPGEGRLYLYSGANRRNRPHTAKATKDSSRDCPMYHAVRCAACVAKRGDKLPAAPAEPEHYEERLRLMEGGLG